jgi:zinc finger CCCH domain-containing protein 13
LRERKRGER